jgi:uncharacterized membrane protein
MRQKILPGRAPAEPFKPLAALLSVFSQMFPDALFLLALAAAWIVLAMSFRKKTDVTERLLLQPAECVGWLFLLIPLAGFVVAEVVTKAFDARYFIGTLPGIAVAFACLLWQCFPEKGCAAEDDRSQQQRRASPTRRCAARLRLTSMVLTLMSGSRQPTACPAALGPPATAPWLLR